MAGSAPGSTGPRVNPFAAPNGPPPSAPTPPSPPSPTPARSGTGLTAKWWAIVLGVVAVLAVLLAGRVVWGGGRSTPQPVEPRAVRDVARDLNAQLWKDLEQTAHLTGVYGEMFWRSATPNERLLVACKYGELDLMKALLEAGANVNYRDHGVGEHLAVEWEGATPLMLAARRGRLDLASYLVDHGAEVNATDAGGDTSLHWAIRGRAQPVALYLVQHGADPNQVSRRTNSTAYGLAFGAGMSDVLVEMEQRGGHF